MITEQLTDWSIDGLSDNEEVTSVTVSYEMKVVKATTKPGFIIHFTGTALVYIDIIGEGIGEVDENGREEKIAEVIDSKLVSLDITEFQLDEGSGKSTQRYEAILEIDYWNEEETESYLHFQTS